METPFYINEFTCGKVKRMERCAPGVWLLETNGWGTRITIGADGGYAVPLPYEGGILSEQALSYGAEECRVLIFDESHGKCIVEYELLRAERRAKATGATGELDQRLKTIAAYGAEDYPEYFGALPPPVETPLGPVTRYIRAADGVYFVESGAQWMLSISFPVWKYLHYLKKDRYQGVFIGQTMCGDVEEAVRTCAYMFFKREQCAPALYLLLYESTVHLSIWDYVKKDSFVAALWQYPKLVEEHNEDLKQMIALFKPHLNDPQFICFMQEKLRDYLPPAETEDTDFLRLPH